MTNLLASPDVAPLQVVYWSCAFLAFEGCRSSLHEAREPTARTRSRGAQTTAMSKFEAMSEARGVGLTDGRVNRDTLRQTVRATAKDSTLLAPPQHNLDVAQNEAEVDAIDDVDDLVFSERASLIRLVLQGVALPRNLPTDGVVELRLSAVVELKKNFHS